MLVEQKRNEFANYGGDHRLSDAMSRARNTTAQSDINSSRDEKDETRKQQTSVSPLYNPIVVETELHT